MTKKISKKKTTPEKEESSIAHYNGILIESINDQVKMIAEIVGTTRESLEGKMGALGVELRQAIFDTQVALSARIDETKKELRKELADTKKELSDKLDHVIECVDRHDVEIAQLKKVQNL